MRKSLPALTLVLAATLAACNSGDNAASQSQPAQTAAAAPAAAPAAAADTGDAAGLAVFNRTCVTCHQANGQGLPGAYPPYDPAIVAGDKARLIRLVLHGMMGPITVMGNNYNNVMTPWNSLSDADIAAVLTYVRHHFGNGASAVTVEEVAAERAATSSRTTPYAPADLGL